MGSQMLELLRVLLIVLGILGALWGVYDMMGDGQQSSVGIKKLIGGIAFSIITGITFTWAISSVKSAEAKAGITAAAYNAAIRNNKCSKNPALALTIPEASEKEIRALTREEEESIIAAAKNDVLGHLSIFMLETGLRAGELRDLKWSDYSPEKYEIYVRKSKTKNGIRTVPLTSEAKKIIDNQKHYCDYIFTSTTKQPLTKTVLRKLYERLRKATGINIVTNHVYRHSFATRMVEKKADYKALSVILGHKNVAFTIHRYADAETSFLHEQIALKDQKPKKRIMHVKSMHVFRR